MRAALPLAACGGALAAAAPPRGSVVRVAEGELRGSCDDASGVCSYLGVPFAAPPVGPLRWRPPQPAPRWRGVRDATAGGPVCVQPASGSGDPSKDPDEIDGDESCLFLNVFTPASCARGGCAVMFWIHGGAYVGGGITGTYNGTDLAAYGGVVVVAVQYRLGVLGFAGADELRAGDADAGSTGNYGIQDQRAGMEWVRDNVHSFGGDPRNVMIFGESAGAGSVSNHLTMRRSWPLYHKAVLESGSYSYWAARPMAQAERQFADLKAALGCDTAGCLKQVNGTAVIRAAQHLPAHPQTYGCQVAPTVDGVELTDLPWNLRDAGQYNTKARVMMGFNKDEGTIGIGTPGGSGYDLYKKYDAMTEQDFKQLLTTVDFLEPAVVDAAVRVYKVNKADPMLQNWYWSATHFNGDYGFTCPTRRAARALARHSEHAPWVYMFAHVPAGIPYPFAGLPNVTGSAGASHGAEISFVFHDHGQTPPPPGYGAACFDCLQTPAEYLLSETMMAYWINFARGADPNGPLRTNLTTQWTPFAEKAENIIRLDLPSLSSAMGLFDSRCDVVDSAGPFVPHTPL